MQTAHERSSPDHLRAKRPLTAGDRDLAGLGAILLVVAVVIGLMALTRDGDDPAQGAAAAPSLTDPGQAVADQAGTDQAVAAAPSTTPAAGAPTSDALPDLDIVDAAAAADIADADGCTMTVLSVRMGDTGESVTCLQNALSAAGYFNGTVSGQFDNGTYAAVRRLQEERDLFVDGVAGRETGLSLDIWPDEESFVVRTPPPPPGAVDLLGYPLSSVSSSGSDAPPLPANSGSGKRVVYERAGQRVWAVDANETVIRSWLVTGSQYGNELPGTHQIYSKSDMSTAWNGKAFLPLMIRWLKTDIGHIGFHAIPIHRSDNTPYQTEAELGTRLSGGCQRQANRDARFLWDWAPVGTTVVVI